MYESIPFLMHAGNLLFVNQFLIIMQLIF